MEYFNQEILHNLSYQTIPYFYEFLLAFQDATQRAHLEYFEILCKQDSYGKLYDAHEYHIKLTLSDESIIIDTEFEKEFEELYSFLKDIGQLVGYAIKEDKFFSNAFFEDQEDFKIKIFSTSDILPVLQTLLKDKVFAYLEKKLIHFSSEETLKHYKKVKL